MAYFDKELRAAVRAGVQATAVYFYKDPNVRLIDVGWRIVEKENRRVSDELAVRVHLRKKLRGEAFEAYSALYPSRVISADRIGFAVDIIEADYPLHWHEYWQWPPNERATAQDPLKGGVSISKIWSSRYGTLGGIVIDRVTGDPMILSNWHVLVGSAYLPRGVSICQPASADGGSYENIVARLDRHAMNQGIDAAVARINQSRNWSDEQLGLGSVSGVATPHLSMLVTKSGRASGVTQGIVTGIEGVRKIMYAGYERTVRHVVHIAQAPGNGQVSTGGDSGSWWLDKESLAAVGLHFAGSNVPEYGLAMAMPEVLDALEVDLATAVQPKPMLRANHSFQPREFVYAPAGF